MAKFAARCPRCEGAGRHQRGRCFQCRGARVIGQASSKTLTLHKVICRMDGKRVSFQAWGRTKSDAVEVVRIMMEERGARVASAS